MATVKDIVVSKPTIEQVTEAKLWPTWTCDASQFDWEYTQTEKCLLLKGKVTVYDRPDSGNSVTFGAGDYVILPTDLSCVWEVTEAVEKHYDFE